MNAREKFETFLINSPTDKWSKAMKKSSPIDPSTNRIYFLPYSVKSFELDNLRYTLTPLEISNLLKLLPPKINGVEIRLSTPKKKERNLKHLVYYVKIYQL